MKRYKRSALVAGLLTAGGVLAPGTAAPVRGAWPGGLVHAKEDRTVVNADGAVVGRMSSATDAPLIQTTGLHGGLGLHGGPGCTAAGCPGGAGGAGMPGGGGAAGMAGGSPATTGPRRFPTVRTQVYFLSPQGTRVGWQSAAPGTAPQYVPGQLTTPARYNFEQGNIYRLKLTNIPDHPGLVLYPSLEIAPANPRSDAFLAHNPVPFELTAEDLDQIVSGNFVTKVIYLPDPRFQELAVAGVETLVSTRLEPGVDPIAEAARRGSILAIIRVGNINLELPNVPSVQPTLGAMAPGGMVPPGAAAPPGMAPNAMVPGMATAPIGPGQVPYPPAPSSGGQMPPGYRPAAPGMGLPPGAVIPENLNIPPGAQFESAPAQPSTPPPASPGTAAMPMRNARGAQVTPAGAEKPALPEVETAVDDEAPPARPSRAARATPAAAPQPAIPSIDGDAGDDVADVQ